MEKEQEWVVFIMGELENAKTQEEAPRPSIFMASSPLRGVKLEAFIPQVVAIGPYHSDLGPHHSSFPDNQETQRYKAIAAKEMETHKIMASNHVAKTLPREDFCSLAEEFLQVMGKVREQYDTDLACKLDEKLAYMLALDGSFVVEFLRCTAYYDNSVHSLGAGFNAYYCSRFPRPLRKSILQDFVLLENQIPLFLLLKAIRMDVNCASDEEALQVLGFLVTKLACEVLPFTYLSNQNSFSSMVHKLDEKKHLLDCLYGIVTHDIGVRTVAVKRRHGHRFANQEEPHGSSRQHRFANQEEPHGSSRQHASTANSHQFANQEEPHQFANQEEPHDSSRQHASRANSHQFANQEEPHGSSRQNASTANSAEKIAGKLLQLEEKPTHFPAAVDLYNSGIRFKPVEAGNMSSIRYDAKRAILYVPKVRVGDDTERLLRNLIAYESHLVDANVHVLSYLRFMNSLVDTQEDVALLVAKGIIAQDIGSNDEVAKMWNSLCVNTMRVCTQEYEDVAVQLVQHCQYKMNALKAEFKRTYLSRPWLVISVLSAAALLIMTFVITYYTMKL